jgi:hypothetical protein
MWPQSTEASNIHVTMIVHVFVCPGGGVNVWVIFLALVKQRVSSKLGLLVGKFTMPFNFVWESSSTV